MKFKAFREAIAESDWFDYPHQDGVRFKIRRKGWPGFVERSKDQQKSYLETFRATMREKGTKLGDVRSGDVDFEKMTDDVLLADLDFASFGTGLDCEGIAMHLVEEVEGDIIFEDDGETPIGWRKEVDGKMAGVGLLEHFPDVARWIISKADELEEQFKSVMEASAKNSPSSSAQVVEVEGASV